MKAYLDEKHLLYKNFKLLDSICCHDTNRTLTEFLLLSGIIAARIETFNKSHRIQGDATNLIFCFAADLPYSSKDLTIVMILVFGI